MNTKQSNPLSFLLVVLICVVLCFWTCRLIGSALETKLASIESPLYGASILMIILTGIVGVGGSTYDKERAGTIIHKITGWGWIALSLLAVTVASSICNDALKGRLAAIEKMGSNEQMLTLRSEILNQEILIANLQKNLSKVHTSEQTDSIWNDFSKKYRKGTSIMVSIVKASRDSSFITNYLTRCIMDSVRAASCISKTAFADLKRSSIQDSISLHNLSESYRSIKDELASFAKAESIAKGLDSVKNSKLDSYEAILDQMIVTLTAISGILSEYKKASGSSPENADTTRQEHFLNSQNPDAAKLKPNSVSSNQ